MTDNDHRDKSLPVIVLIIAAILIAGAIYWFLKRDKPVAETLPPPAVIEPEQIQVEPPEEEPEQLQPAEPTPPEPSAPTQATTKPPEVKLPSLDRSDVEVKQQLLEVSEGDFQSWMVEDHLIRKFVRALNALEEGKLVAQYRPVQDLKTPFQAQSSGNDQWNVAANNYQRYTPYIESLENVGPEKLAVLFQRYGPLLDQAYDELGLKKGDFNAVTVRALNRIIKAPALPADAALIRPSVMYRFASPELEQRSGIEKLLFRMGPDNTQRVKKLAQDILAEIQKPQS